jgi:hypothetical protein
LTAPRGHHEEDQDGEEYDAQRAHARLRHRQSNALPGTADTSRLECA